MRIFSVSVISLYIKRLEKNLASRFVILVDIIKYPLFSEKILRLVEQNQYSFAVKLKATKIEIKSSIKKLFDVTIDSVVISILFKMTRRTEKFETSNISRYKKAVVKLVEGSKINIFATDSFIC